MTKALAIKEGKTLAQWAQSVEFQKSLFPYTVKNNIAIIDLIGVIGDGWQITLNGTRILTEMALKDDGVKGIIYKINSPGGEVSETFRIADYLKNKVNKPNMAYIEQTATSGAMLIASALSSVYANEFANLGSIGVILTARSQAKKDSNEGLEYITFKSYQYKDMLNPHREMTDEEKTILQNEVNETSQHFVSKLKEYRKEIDVQAIDKKQALTFSSSEALELKLIDGIEDIDKAFEIFSEKIDKMQVIYDKSDIDITENQDNTMSDKERAELETAKQYLIDSYKASYYKAAGREPAGEQLEMLSKSSIQDIKMQVESLQPIIESRFKTEKVRTPDVVSLPTEPPTKERDESWKKNASIMLKRCLQEANVKPENFDFNTAINESIDGGDE